MHLALASAYPTEAAARNGITENLRAAALSQFRGSQYHGVWRTAPPQCTAVHVFGEVDGARLLLDGWTPEPDTPSARAIDPQSVETGPVVPAVGVDHPNGSASAYPCVACEPDRKADEA